VSRWWTIAALVALSPGVAAAAPIEVRWTDADGAPIDVGRSGLVFTHSPPAATGVDGPSVLLVSDAPIPDVTLTSKSESGARVDSIASLPTRPASCPPGVNEERVCRIAGPIRLAIDATDRAHPVVKGRSLVAELGGTVAVSASGHELGAVRVVGPRRTEVGDIDRLRGRLRVFLVRDRVHGGPPFGASDAIAVGLVRQQIARTNAVWGQCGVSFGAPEDADVRLVDPPPAHLVAIGCDLAIPASGGEVRMRAEGHEVRVPTRPGDLPRVVAHRLQRALEAARVSASISHNLPIGPAAFGSTDLLVRHGKGPGTIERVVSTDPTMKVCLGTVDLSDGLQHFSDVDAVSGTVEERALLKAFDDGDPGTIEVIFVPAFATGGRIGESFIRGDRSTLPSMLIEDRAGVRADDISFALAHELGHVLLDVPGHSDDFGVDTPTRLMDSDAADASAFGPRRLDAAECVRAVRQSGPASPTPLLTPWPFR
jgi:hypothetical protein